MDEINTEQAFRDEFAGRVKTVTLDELPAFLSELLDREHDYGTICHALAIGAAATAWAMNKHPQGGITGFQAGAIAWEFLRNWGSLYPGECGGRMQDFDNLLYPQWEERFTTISAETWERIQKKAAEKLASSDAAADSVKAHWQSIVDGNVPFGLGLAA